MNDMIACIKYMYYTRRIPIQEERNSPKDVEADCRLRNHCFVLPLPSFSLISPEPCPPIWYNGQLDIVHIRRIDDHQSEIPQRHFPVLPCFLRHALTTSRPQNILKLPFEFLRPVLRLFMSPRKLRARGERSTPRSLHVRTHRIKHLPPLLLPIEAILIQCSKRRSAGPACNTLSSISVFFRR